MSQEEHSNFIDLGRNLDASRSDDCSMAVLIVVPEETEPSVELAVNMIDCGLKNNTLVSNENLKIKEECYSSIVSMDYESYYNCLNKSDGTENNTVVSNGNFIKQEPELDLKIQKVRTEFLPPNMAIADQQSPDTVDNENEINSLSVDLQCFSEPTCIASEENLSGSKPNHDNLSDVVTVELGRITNYSTTEGDQPVSKWIVQGGDCVSVKGETVLLTEANMDSAIYDGKYQSLPKCEQCGKLFKTQANLHVHMRIHIGLKPYECEVCQKCFTQKTSLNKHALTHTGEKPWKCKECKKRFSCKYHLTRHAITHSGERPYKCTICSKGFSQTSSLRKHWKIHLGAKTYVCKECGRGFSDNYHLVRHSLIHIKKEFKCDICDEVFNNIKALREHVAKNHTVKVEVENKIKKSQELKKKHQKGTNLSKSKKLIVNSMKVRINISKLKKTKKTKRTTAKKAVHSTKKTKRTTAKKAVHSKTLKPENKVTRDVEHRFECNVCEKKFHFKCHLKTHTVTHLIKKEFNCSECRKGYSHERTLKMHMISKHPVEKKIMQEYYS